MDRTSLHGSILSDLHNRSQWEARQATFYKMRHDGLRRRSKPWPGAADTHYPLADTIINKLKPYYFEQIYATETLATFVCCKPDMAPLATEAARWFDYQLKQGSNLETEILTVIDFMLQSGRSVCKTFWDPFKKAIAFDAIYPRNLIVPYHTASLATADRFVQVLPMSVQAYRSMPNFKQDEALIAKMRRTMPDANDTGGEAYQKEVREGITCPSRDGEVIIWEVHQKDSKGNWTVDTYSPMCPDETVRATFAEDEHPYVDFYYEVKDKGWYSPRGIPELVAPHEASLTKMWNEKLDCITLYNRPLFRSDQQIPNTLNLDFRPGQVLPYGITSMPHNSPPMSFDQEMQQTRMVAEQRVAMPDYGMGQLLNQNTRRTAKEVGEISEVMGNALDLRMRVFRHSLGKLYRLCWTLLKRHKKADLAYYFSGEAQALNEDVLSQEYDLQPTGSADGVSKQYIYQKAVTRFQMFNQDPFINQGELRKSILESDDVALVRRLYVSPEGQAATQQEDQALEIAILKEGFPAQVQAWDNHQVHIQTCVQYLQSRQQLGEPFNPVAAQRVVEHVMAHIEALKQTDPKAATQITQELQAMAQPAQAGPGQEPMQAELA